MKLTRDHAPAIAILSLTLLSYLIIHFPKITALAVITLLFSVQSKSNDKNRKTKVVAARQSEEIIKDDQSSEETLKDSLEKVETNGGPNHQNPELTKNENKIRNIATGTTSMKDVE